MLLEWRLEAGGVDGRVITLVGPVAIGTEFVEEIEIAEDADDVSVAACGNDAVEVSGFSDGESEEVDDFGAVGDVGVVVVVDVDRGVVLMDVAVAFGSGEERAAIARGGDGEDGGAVDAAGGAADGAAYLLGIPIGEPCALGVEGRIAGGAGEGSGGGGEGGADSPVEGAEEVGEGEGTAVA